MEKQTQDVPVRLFHEHLGDGAEVHGWPDLMERIVNSGAKVTFSHDFPAEILGMQYDDSIIINNTAAMTPQKRCAVLAHEWFHYLRREDYGYTKARFYSEALPSTRDAEERYAHQFERLVLARLK